MEPALVLIYGYAIELGLNKFHTGIRCLIDVSALGKKIDDLPSKKTFYELLNRQGYHRRMVAKSKVQKNEIGVS